MELLSHPACGWATSEFTSPVERGCALALPDAELTNVLDELTFTVDAAAVAGVQQNSHSANADTSFTVTVKGFLL
jgi:hypothetical protein